MTITITLFCVLILLAGIFLLINPKPLFDFLGSSINKTYVYFSAVVVRLLFGALLIATASQTKFPVAVQILGWLTVAVAVGLLVMGNSNFKRLLSWVLSRFAPYARISGIAAMLFGGFLIYAYV